MMVLDARWKPMLDRTRENLWDEARETVFDMAVVGGGINGASLYHELCSRGYRVLLVDKGDFACGTSHHAGLVARYWLEAMARARRGQSKTGSGLAK